MSLDAGNLGFRVDLANILMSAGDDQAAIETLRSAVALAKTPEETVTLDQQLRDAMKYAAERAIQNQGTGVKAAASENETPEPARPPDSGFVPGGPHRFVVGVLKEVHCDSAALDLTVTSPTGTMRLHSDNYYRIQFTALVASTQDLQPCRDLENRPAKVEYVESQGAGATPHLVAVELHK